jgi:hypothetical protein
MKADKLFYVFELTKKRLLSFKPRPGNATLANTALKMTRKNKSLTQINTDDKNQHG